MYNDYILSYRLYIIYTDNILIACIVFNISIYLSIYLSIYEHNSKIG